VVFRRVTKLIQQGNLLPCALRAFGVLGGRVSNALERKSALENGSYRTNVRVDASRFPSFFSLDESLDVPSQERETLSKLSASFCQHRFDLLGSGWVNIFRGMSPNGLEGVSFTPNPVADKRKPFKVNQSNFSESNRIWCLIRRKDYEPIHWHIAYRSGYEWSPECWRTDARKGLPRGVDIKEPWELSRMQHLVPMALHTTLEPEDAQATVEEIESQILDFIASNPPGFGVNWACTMDVALRACSWLISFDLCRASSAQFSDEFMKVFGRSIYEHAHFISHHVEWSDLTRGNHYLFDVIGLLFCSAYLPQTKQTDEWFAFATREFLREIERQFNEDGSNIECSTAYHCFVSEAVTYTVSLLVSVLKFRGESAVKILPEGPLGFLAKRAGHVWFSKRNPRPDPRVASDSVNKTLAMHLDKMKGFIEDITRPDGSIINVGDNDSGFFVKLGNKYAESLTTGDELLQDLHRGHVFCLINDFLHGTTSIWVSAMLPARLSLPECRTKGHHISVGKKSPLKEHSSKFTFSRMIPIPSEGSAWCCRHYPQFGLWSLRNDVVYVAVRLLPVSGQVVSHAHSDLLSTCVSIGESNPIEDPGVPFYTPFPDIAAQYRSATVHFAPEGISAEVLKQMDVRTFSDGVSIFSGRQVLLEVQIEKGNIRIRSDYPLPNLRQGCFRAVPVSPGYGKIT